MSAVMYAVFFCHQCSRPFDVKVGGLGRHPKYCTSKCKRQRDRQDRKRRLKVVAP